MSIALGRYRHRAQRHGARCIALLCTVVAYILYFRILAAAGATNLLLVTFLIPVSATLLGSLVLGEALLVRDFAGTALIGVGLAFIDGRLLAAFLARPSPVSVPFEDPSNIEIGRHRRD